MSKSDRHFRRLAINPQTFSPDFPDGHALGGMTIREQLLSDDLTPEQRYRLESLEREQSLEYWGY